MAESQLGEAFVTARLDTTGLDREAAAAGEAAAKALAKGFTDAIKKAVPKMFAPMTDGAEDAGKKIVATFKETVKAVEKELDKLDKIGKPDRFEVLGEQARAMRTEVINQVQLAVSGAERELDGLARPDRFAVLSEQARKASEAARNSVQDAVRDIKADLATLQTPDRFNVLATQARTAATAAANAIRDAVRDISRALGTIGTPNRFLILVEQAREAIAAVRAELGRLGGVRVGLDLDAAAFEAALARIQSLRPSVTVDLDIDEDQFRTELALVTAGPGGAVEVRVEANLKAFVASLAAIVASGALTPVAIPIIAAPAGFRASVEEAVQEATRGGQGIVIPVEAEGSQFLRDLNKIRQLAEGITPVAIPTSLGGEGALALRLEEIIRDLESKATKLLVKVDGDSTMLKETLRRDIEALQTFANRNPVKVPVDANMAPFFARVNEAIDRIQRNAGAQLDVDIDRTRLLTQLNASIASASASADPVRVRMTPNSAGFLAAVTAVIQQVELQIPQLRVRFDLPNSPFGALVAAGAAAAQSLIVSFGIAATTIRAALERIGTPSPFDGVITEATASAAAIAAAYAAAAAAARTSLAGIGVSPAAITNAGKTAKGIENEFSKMFDRITNLGKKFGRGFVLSTGIAAAIGESITLAIGGLGLNFAQENEVLILSLDALSDQLVGVGGDITAFRQKLLDVAAASPLGVNDVTEAVIKLSSTLGSDGQEAIDQLDKITRALAVVPNGLTPDKLNSVTTALGQISSFSKLTFDNLNQISNAIPTFSRGALFEEIARSMFKLGDNAEVTAEQIDKVKAKIASPGGLRSEIAIPAILEVFADTEGADKALDNFNKSFTGTLQRIKETIKAQLGDAFLPLLQSLTPVLDRLGPVIADALVSVVPAFSRQIESLVPIVEALIPAFINASTTIADGFTDIFTAIGPEGFKGFADAIKGFFATVGPAVAAVVKAIVDAAPAFAPFLKAVVQLGAAFGSFLKDVGGPALQILGKALSGLAPIIKLLAIGLVALGKTLGFVFGNEVVQNITAFIASFFLAGGVFTKVGKIFAFVGRGISATVTAIVNRLGFLRNAVFTIRAAFQLLGNAIAPVGSVLRNVGSIISSVVQIIVRTLGNFGSRLAEVLRIPLQVIAGLGAAFENVRDAALAAIDGILAGIQKVAEGAGNIPLLGRLFNIAGADDAARAIANLRDGLKESTDGFKSTGAAATGAAAAVNTATQGITASVNKAAASVTKATDALRGSLEGVSSSFNQSVSDQIATGASKSVDAIAEVRKALDALPTNADSSINIRIGDALNEIAIVQNGLNAIPDKKSTEYQIAADAARSQILTLLQSLGDIPAVKDILIRLTTQTVDLRTVKDSSGRTAAERQALLRKGIDPDTVAPGVSPEEEDARRRAAAGFGASTGAAFADGVKRALSGGSGGGGGGGGTSGPSAKELARKAAADAFNEFRKNIANEFRHTKDYIEGLVSQDASGIHTQLVALLDELRDGFREAGKPFPKALGNSIKDASQKLQAMAIRLGKVNSLLDKARDKFASVRDGVKDFASITADFSDAAETAAETTRQSFETRILDVAGSFEVIRTTIEKSVAATQDGVKRIITAGDIKQRLQDQLAQIKAFQANIAQLQKLGLNKTLIDEIISSGVEGGSATAAALAQADKATIDSINATRKLIDKAATELGRTAIVNAFGDQAKALGVNIVNGLINGLKDKASDIEKAMEAIALRLIRAIEKRLDINSPSVVMHTIGGHVAAGLANGITAGGAGVDSAISGMADRVAGMSLPDVGALNTSALEGSMASLRNMNLPSLDLNASVGQIDTSALDGLTSKLAKVASPNLQVDQLSRQQLELVQGRQGLTAAHAETLIRQNDQLIAATQGAPRTTVKATNNITVSTPAAAEKVINTFGLRR